MKILKKVSLKVLIIILISLLLTSRSLASDAFSEHEVENVFYNNNIIGFNRFMGYIESKDDVVMVPVRVVAERIGYKVSWDDINRQVSIVDLEDNILILTVDSPIVKLNGENIKINNKNMIPYIKDSKFMVPIDFVAKCFNQEISYKYQGDREIILLREYSKNKKIRKIEEEIDKIISFKANGSMRFKEDRLKQIIDNIDLTTEELRGSIIHGYIEYLDTKNPYTQLEYILRYDLNNDGIYDTVIAYRNINKDTIHIKAIDGRFGSLMGYHIEYSQDYDIVVDIVNLEKNNTKKQIPVFQEGLTNDRGRSLFLLEYDDYKLYKINDPREKVFSDMELVYVDDFKIKAKSKIDGKEKYFDLSEKEELIKLGVYDKTGKFLEDYPGVYTNPCFYFLKDAKGDKISVNVILKQWAGLGKSAGLISVVYEYKDGDWVYSFYK